MRLHFILLAREIFYLFIILYYILFYFILMIRKEIANALCNKRDLLCAMSRVTAEIRWKEEWKEGMVERINNLNTELILVNPYIFIFTYIL